MIYERIFTTMVKGQIHPDFWIYYPRCGKFSNGVNIQLYKNTKQFIVNIKHEKLFN